MITKTKRQISCYEKGIVRAALMNALNDSSKTVIVQLVLCQYWSRYANFAGPKTVTEHGEHINKYYLREEKREGLIISEKK